ncbi:MAG: hypothetical protein KIT87_09020 [Anaerolineae bacterium]|nr:hypothetical protein [Anaerolineae bacterium]
MIQKLVWWALIGVCVVYGLMGVRQAIQEQAPGAPGAWETTDAWLASLELASPSASIRASLTHPADEGAALFVGLAGDSSFPLTYYVISYLAWPRRVGAVQCGPQAGQAMPYVPLGTRITTVLFYRRTAPAFLGQATSLGPYLRQVSERETRDWTQYCSR